MLLKTLISEVAKAALQDTCVQILALNLYSPISIHTLLLPAPSFSFAVSDKDSFDLALLPFPSEG